MDAPLPADVALALYQRLLQASAGHASHHGSHAQDPAYYDRFGETIAASHGSPAASIAVLAQRPDLLERGAQHANPEVIVVTMRLAALTMAADLPPHPETHPAFFSAFASLLGVGPAPAPATATPRVREAAMYALGKGCAGSRSGAWAAAHLSPLVQSLSHAMADGALHRLASAASALLASLLHHFGSAALAAVEASLSSALDGAPATDVQLKLSLMDLLTALICDLRAAPSLVGALLPPSRRSLLLTYLRDADTVVRGRAISALLLIARSGGLDALGGEQTVLDFAKSLCDTPDGLPHGAELLGGLTLSSDALQRLALEHLSVRLDSLKAGGFVSRQKCVALAAVLSAVDARTASQPMPAALSSSLVSLLASLRLDAASMAAPQRLFKVLIRILEHRAPRQAADDLMAQSLPVLLSHLVSMHEQHLHQLAVDVIRCIGVILPALASAAPASVATPLTQLADFAVARLAEPEGAWEVRDSVAEMLGTWAAVPPLRSWCLRPAFVRGLRQLASQADLEPFVYATVATTLTAYAASAEGWAFMAREEEAFLACCSASLAAQESLLRRSALSMLAHSLRYAHSAAAVRAYMTAPQCRTSLVQRATDDDFEVRAALVRLLSSDLWPDAAFFELSGPHVLTNAVRLPPNPRRPLTLTVRAAEGLAPPRPQ